jgi:hypothetical protein
MKFNLFALSTAAALAGTDAFLSSSQQPRQQSSSSSALYNYSPYKWSPGGTATSFPPSQSSFTSSAVSAPPAGCPFHANYDAIREELKLILDNPSWDDGSLAPIFIRLAWHSSGTYDAATGTGGSNGAGMRFQNEAADPENAGLAVARAFLEPVKRKFPEISYSGEYRYCYKMMYVIYYMISVK